MDQATVDAIIAGTLPDDLGLRGLQLGWNLSWYGGIALLWIAAALTLITGWDYFRKALPYLRDPK
jgi:CDP-diacylglycerol--glycerol-3-phosphate 3-phosphatidyltransferase